MTVLRLVDGRVIPYNGVLQLLPGVYLIVIKGPDCWALAEICSLLNALLL